MIRAPVLPLLALLAAAAMSHAGPLEARRLYDRAKALRDAPWRERVTAWRAVVREAHPTDRLRARALLALARDLREADHPAGAAAAEAWAAAALPLGEEARQDATMALGRGLRDQGDLDGAREALLRAEEEGRGTDPTSADRALELLSEDAADRRERRFLAELRERGRRRGAAPSVRIRIEGRRGLLALDAGDRAEALRALAEAETLAREASERSDAESVLASKAWLDLPLRARLREEDG